MADTREVANRPRKPLLIYDGECNFCRRWIGRWRQATGSTVDYLPSQDAQIGTRFPELPPEIFGESVQLVERDGSVHSGAEAVLKSLALGGKGGLYWLYKHAPGFAGISEGAYRFVAGHRSFFSMLTRWLWGEHVERPRYLQVRLLFLRLLGAIWLVAFLSLWTQVSGLIGENGISPAAQLMDGIQRAAIQRDIGWDAYRLVPTLCWISASDAILHGLCAAGVLCSVLVIVGVAPALALLGAWAAYLSLATVSGVFLGFQWDALLLEVGFLSIFLAPLRLWPSRASYMTTARLAVGEDHVPTAQPWFGSGPSTMTLWLLRWLLFRLNFSSGCVKLMSGDTTWRDFTALNYHYETQPLPTRLGWYAHHLPDWFQTASVVAMFAIELVVPFLIFGPRRMRFAAAGILGALQIGIALTGNYCFFNALTLALCVLLLDDAALQGLLRWRPRIRAATSALEDPIVGTRAQAESANLQPEPSLKRERRQREWPVWITAPMGVTILVLTCAQLWASFRGSVDWNAPLLKFYSWLQPFRTLNHYGLFAVMTTTRPEIIVEGSKDQQNWLEYEFKFKPGDLEQAPRWVAPHQPRLDWQMWFAALGSHQNNRWFLDFCVRLLQGSPEVLGLLERNPFPSEPPRYVRAVLYDYTYTDMATRRSTGKWWHRERKGLYCPVLTLQDGKPAMLTP